MSAGIMVQRITSGIIITPVLFGPLQIRVLPRILTIMSEATLQGTMYKGEVIHLQDITFLPVNTGQILTEVREAILFPQEAVIHQVLMEVLLPEAADLHHHTAADLLVLHQEVLTLQDLLLGLPQDLLRGLPQVVEVLLQEGDSLKQ